MTSDGSGGGEGGPHRKWAKHFGAWRHAAVCAGGGPSKAKQTAADGHEV